MTANYGIVDGVQRNDVPLGTGIPRPGFFLRSDGAWASAGFTAANNYYSNIRSVPLQRGIPNTLAAYLAQGAVGLTINRLCFHYFNIVEPITICNAYTEVTTAVASSNVVLGLYGAEIRQGAFFPTRLVTQFGGPVSSASTGIKTVSGLNVSLNPGLYALAYNCDSSGVALRHIRGYTIGSVGFVANSGNANVFYGLSNLGYSLTYSSVLPSHPPEGFPLASFDASGSGYVQSPIWFDWISG